jgi:hypothetical protein
MYRLHTLTGQTMTASPGQPADSPLEQLIKHCQLGQPLRRRHGNIVRDEQLSSTDAKTRLPKAKGCGAHFLFMDVDLGRWRAKDSNVLMVLHTGIAIKASLYGSSFSILGQSRCPKASWLSRLLPASKGDLQPHWLRHESSLDTTACPLGNVMVCLDAICFFRTVSSVSTLMPAACGWQSMFDLTPSGRFPHWIPFHPTPMPAK